MYSNNNDDMISHARNNKKKTHRVQQMSAEGMYKMYIK